MAGSHRPLDHARMGFESRNIVWLKRTLRLVLFLGGPLVLYMLSFAPVARLCGAPHVLFEDLPPAVRVFYTPYAFLYYHLPEGVFHPLNQYGSWWINGEAAWPTWVFLVTLTLVGIAFALIGFFAFKPKKSAA
jgi:hypothetical protein